MNKLLASTLVCLGLAAATASLVMAQTTNPPATTGARTPHGARHQHEQRAFSQPSERVEARLAYIKTALKITDAQQQQWNAFADTLRKQAAERGKQMQAWRDRMAQRAEHRQPTAIGRLERQQQFFAAAAARLGERLAVQKPLYAALSDDQKRVADRVLAPRVRNGMFRHREMHRMG